jgi:adenylate cyclase
MARLVILEGEGRGAIFDLTESVAIGRSRTATIQLAGRQISAMHARILRKGEAYHVQDLDSRNGTFLNGKKTIEDALQPGDRIKIGNVLLVFEPAFDFRAPDSSGAGVILLPESSDIQNDICSTVSMPDGSATQPMEPVDEQGNSVPADALATANSRLRTVYEVTRVLTSTMDEGQLLNRLLEILLGILQAERGVVILCEESGQNVMPVAIMQRTAGTANVSISKTVLNYVLRNRKAVLSSNASVDPRFDMSDSILIDNVKSVMCAPLITKDRLIGAIYVDTQQVLRTFDEDDLSLLTNICAQAAGAVENARSFTRVKEEASQFRKKIQQDMQIVGDSPAIRHVLRQIEKVARTDSSRTPFTS